MPAVGWMKPSTSGTLENQKRWPLSEGERPTVHTCTECCLQLSLTTRPWIWFKNTCKSGRLGCWALRLMEFDFTIQHHPGAKNQVADALSRVNLPAPTEQLDYEPPLYHPTLALLEGLPDLFCVTPTPVLDEVTLAECEEHYHKCAMAYSLYQLLAVTVPKSSTNWDNLRIEHMREFAAAQCRDMCLKLIVEFLECPPSPEEP